MNYTDFELLNDSVLIKRIEEEAQDGVSLTDDPLASNKPIIREGIVMAVGPGKWIEGTWWKMRKRWKWIDGYREQPEIKPGMRVLFNARWNDLAHGELRGTGSDGSGPLCRPLSYRYDQKVHLVQEADIAGILSYESQY